MVGRIVRWVAATLAALVGLAGLTIILPGAIGTAGAQSPPSTCPTGTTLNAATNTCQDGSICPAGVVLAGGACTAPAVNFCPAGPGGTAGVVPNPLPPPAFVCLGPPPPTAADCPAGTAFTPGTPPFGLDATCGGPPRPCAAGLVANAAGICTTAPTCAAGETFVPQVGLCFLPRSAGPAFANGGNGGDVAGGDGGRGGNGIAPQCNQNTDGSVFSDGGPAVDCAAGGVGGAGGNAGESDGGNGGLAFSDSPL